MNKEHFEDAVLQLKRADHLIFVSLKYTRTVDVIKSIIQRLINTYDEIFKGILEEKKEKGEIEDVPPAPMVKCEKLKTLFADNEMFLSHLNLYTLLRKLNRTNYTQKNEFRRHVAMVAEMPEGDIMEIGIDQVTEFYEKTKSFISYIFNEF